MTTFAAPSTGREVKAVLFDTFGTVVDWRTGVATACAEFFARHHIELYPEQFADLWRALYEPSMEPVRNNERQFVPLDELHLENLRAALERSGIPPTRFAADELSELNAAWERLDPWNDSVPGLAALAERYIVGPLSNANTALLLRMAQRAGLPWSIVIGADATRAYKPTAEAYRGMAHILRLDPGEVMLAAAHNTDLSAARAAGLATGFVARPTELGPAQTKDLAAEGDWDVIEHSIIGLADALAPAPGNSTRHRPQRAASADTVSAP